MYVAHLDADAFYVSAERVRDSALAGVPVGVLGNQGACVIAKSYEMRAAGVKTGMPIWEAVKLCPEGVYIKRDFRWYEVLSRRMLDVVNEISPRVEYYSIDEFFFQPHRNRNLQVQAEEARDRINAHVGVPVTIAFGRTRTLAKLFSDTAKPFGARAVLNRDDERELLATLPVTEISGIGGRRGATLEPYGIKTCLDYANADRVLIRRLLTRVGEAIWYEINGEQTIPIQTSRPPHKHIARGGSLGGKVADRATMDAWLVRNMERLVDELDFYEVRVGQLVVYLAYEDGQSAGGSVRLDAPTDRLDVLLDAGHVALNQAYRPRIPATHMHVISGDLRRKGCYRPGLFDPPSEPYESLRQVRRLANERVGRFAVRSGATLHLKSVYDDTSNDFDICDVRGKICF